MSVEKVAQLAAARRMAQLADRLGLDLANAFAGDPEPFTDLIEGTLLTVGEPETQLQDTPFARRQRVEHALHLGVQNCQRRGIRRCRGVLVLNEIAEAGVLLVANGRLQRHRVARDPPDLADTTGVDSQLVCDLVVGGVATKLLEQASRHPDELVDRLDHVDWHSDGAPLVGDGASDRLSYPPRGVRGELEATMVVEFLHGADEAEVSLLDEVEEGHTATDVLLGDADHEAKVGLGQRILGGEVALLDELGVVHLLRRSEQRHPADLTKVHANGVVEGHRVGGFGLGDGGVIEVVDGLEIAVAVVDGDADVGERAEDALEMVWFRIDPVEGREHVIGGERTLFLATHDQRFRRGAEFVDRCRHRHVCTSSPGHDSSTDIQRSSHPLNANMLGTATRRGWSGRQSARALRRSRGEAVASWRRRAARRPTSTSSPRSLAAAICLLTSEISVTCCASTTRRMQSAMAVSRSPTRLSGSSTGTGSIIRPAAKSRSWAASECRGNDSPAVVASAISIIRRASGCRTDARSSANSPVSRVAISGRCTHSVARYASHDAGLGRGTPASAAGCAAAASGTALTCRGRRAATPRWAAATSEPSVAAVRLRRRAACWTYSSRAAASGIRTSTATALSAAARRASMLPASPSPMARSRSTCHSGAPGPPPPQTPPGR